MTGLRVLIAAVLGWGALLRFYKGMSAPWMNYRRKR